MSARHRCVAFLVAAAAASVAPAQFVHDLVDRRIAPHPRPPRFAPIVVEKHAVHVKLVDGVATTTVRQTFRNPNGVQLEGTYFFPMPEDAAVDGFSMMMGGKMTSGEVLEKDKAAAIYRSIVSRLADPALLEYVGRRLFQAKVFPIPAQGTAEIELVYSETLPRNGGVLEYRYPLRTAGPSPYPVNEASLIVEAESKAPMRAVYSPSHQIDVAKKGDFAFKASFEQKPCVADRDFTLVIGLGGEAVGATLLTHVEEGEGGAFLLLLAPAQTPGGETVAKDVVFVADTSGSMAGEKMEQLKRALTFCVRSLNPADRFGLVAFSTEARTWKDALETATPEAREAAVRFVAEQRAAGGTNISDAVGRALSFPQEAGRPFMVIFLTDGRPTVGSTATETILKEAREKNAASTRFFVFGIGTDVNVELLDRLADEHRGARDYVGEREDLELKVSSFYEKIAHPVLADVEVRFEGVKVDETYPRRLPDLFRGEQLLLAGRYREGGPAKAIVRGKVNGAPKELSYDVVFGTGSKHPSIARLWAVRKIGYLIDQIRLHGAGKELKDEIVRLGVRYGVVTPYTSYLVVEDVPLGQTGAPAPGSERRDAGDERRRRA
ncbi:MAG TPA: VIT domain-containing protein, partial [Planctomycetota bacterium]|nr:VIT domain-containing protein [Planctomycetota bacterium]